jgi:DNA double-strand break repair helicase HerA and related ATPase
LESNDQLLGVVVGQTKPHHFHFLAKRAVSMGEYVTVTSPEGILLGLAEDSATKSDLLDRVSNFQTAIEAKRVAAKNVRDKSYLASVKVVGLLDALRKGTVVLPSLPPEPGSEVLEAETSEISRVFDRKDRQWVQVGSLLRNPKVRVSVNIDKVASRHLAILSVTGSGKSNLLALITKKVSELQGTMVVFDYHGEYSELDIPRVVHADAKINPRFVDAEELADLIEVRENAEVQRTVLTLAFTDEVKAAKQFWDVLLAAIAAIGASDKQYKKAVARLLDIVKMAMKRMKSVIDPDVGEVLDQLKISKINILNMLEFTERQANAAISYYLAEILDDRKRAVRAADEEQHVRFRTPVICAVEEAHAFIPSEGDSDTKYIASKIAREGRKFGMTLIVVSQRPRRVDQDVLSQMGSFAVMKLTNPEDQGHIREASEAISEDLLQNLPSLNVGEAVLLGEWVNIPAVVKIDHVAEKKTGADISATALWAAEEKLKQVAVESTKSSMVLD